jgi:hypothetical protein
MKRYYRIIRDSAAHLSEAANKTVESLVDKRIEQEPAFTDRMLGRIEQSMTEFEVKGVMWTAKTLTDRGRGTQEIIYGADFIGVLDIHLPDYKVKKGFLAQSKLIEPEDYQSPSEFTRMQEQCEKMLSITPDSFLFLYSIHGITIVPAISVVSATWCNPHELYSRSIARFYEEHFQSFIGDRRLKSPSIDVLEEIRKEYKARAAIGLSAKGEYLD